MDISHKEFVITLNEKDKYEKMKENVGNIKQEIRKTKTKEQCEFCEQQVCKLLNIYSIIIIMMMMMMMMMIFMNI